jgi:hypothetical protein
MHTTRRDIAELVILITLLAIPSLAGDSSHDALPASRSGTLTFSKPVRFGQRLLTAGSYKFRCVHKGTYHLMTVHRIFTGPSNRVIFVDKPVTTDYCRMEVLPEKVKASSARMTKDAAGNDVLEEVRIQGEQVRHIFNEPFQLDPDDNN